MESEKGISQRLTRFLGLTAMLLLLFLCSCGSDSNAKGMSNEKVDVIYIQDGAADEFMASLLLTTMPEANLLGVILVNTDTIWNIAMDVQWKLLSLVNKTDIPVGLSGARGFNAFPWSYRANFMPMNNFKTLAPYEPNPDWENNQYPSGDDLLRDLLREAYEEQRQVTVLMVCPAIALVDVLKKNPELGAAIGRLIWMGGAIHVHGNLVNPSVIPDDVTNPYAEWNMFCDPYAADWLFRNTSFPIILFPLDITNQVPLNKGDYFMTKLEPLASQYAYAAIAYESYTLATEETTYHLWDTASACWISHPEFFQPPHNLKLTIVTTAAEQGRLLVSETGRDVQAVLNLKTPDDATPIYDYMIEQYSRN